MTGESDEAREARQRRHEVADAIASALIPDDGKPLPGYEHRLARVLARHAGRRTIEAHMVREVAQLAVGRVQEVEAAAATRLEGFLHAHAIEVARLERVLADERAASAKLREERDSSRALTETRVAGGDESTMVARFSIGTGWSPAALEEVAYRVRQGGGDDHTRIHVADQQHAQAVLPAANLIDLDLRTSPQRPDARPEAGGRPSHVPDPFAKFALTGSRIVHRAKRAVPVLLLGVVTLLAVLGLPTALELLP